MAQPDDEEQGHAFDPDAWVARAARAAAALEEVRERNGTRQPFALEVSERLAGEPLAALKAQLERELGRVPELRLYPVIPPPPPAAGGGERDKDRDTDWLLLVDPGGVLRVREVFSSWGSAFSPEIARWLDALRENGFPPRALPALTRPGAEAAPPPEGG